MVFKKIIKKIQEEKEVILGDATKDKLYSSDQEFPSEELAAKEFKRSVQKLFHVNQWSEMPGITSTFELHDPKGIAKPGSRPEVKDYIKIVLPGPVPENWVTVVDAQESNTSAEFTVSPSINPTKRSEEQDEIEHFFIAEATSTFKVQLEGTKISAYEIGKREGINNDRDAGNRKLINTLIATGGWAGVQEFQWNKLTDFLVHKIELE